MPKDYLTGRMFQSLTVRDLLEARSRHHVRLATQFTNVVGTAIGFFRYRNEEESFNSPKAAEQRLNQELSKESITVVKKTHPARTLETSAVRPWSPPCVLVFVDSWLTPEEFRTSPEKVVPSFLETDDSRLVPTCVILAEKEDAAPDASQHLNFPSYLLGGGFVMAAEVQGREHVSSVGCLVTDGDLTYALTNRHVTGAEPGRIISTYVNDQPIPVGRSSGLSVGKVPSSKVYSKWPGQEAYSNIDASLMLIDDVSQWTTQVYGVGKLDEPFRINFDAALETCIGLKVKAFGGASGSLSGEIVGLFYRYKALGGYDFIADFLIGPRANEAAALRTLPGDSGTLWVVDSDAPADKIEERPDAGKKGKRRTPPEPPRLPAAWYQPIALQWGGHITLGADGKQKFNFALATSVESACRLLEVDIVRDWNIGHPEYWGEMGHYTIGLMATRLITNASPKLADLMSKNSESIGFDETLLKDPNKYHKKKAGYKNVPLADVPDNVWRNPTKYGGRQGLDDHPELNNDGNNHFADMDQKGKGKYKNKTLMQMYQEDPETLSIDTWSEFYHLLNQSGEKTNPGALPFRVWQGFNEMVRCLGDGDLVGYLCVAGTMAHYVGDSCQPLHISRLHHGDPDHQTSTSKKVHEIYETMMLDNHAKAVLKGLNTRLSKASAKAKPKMTTGEDAARGVVELMIKTYDRLSPQKIVTTYGQGHSDESRAQLLWDTYNQETLDNMAACCTFLASIWESAWKVAGAESNFKAADIREFDYAEEIRPAYKPQSFYPSVELSLMKEFCY
jgi:hypothetical protein